MPYLAVQHFTPFQWRQLLSKISKKYLKTDKKDTHKAIGRNPKTVKAHLARLVEYGWIGQDTRRGIYFIRGWGYIRRLLDDRTRAGYHLSFSRIRDFRAFAVAATYDRLIAQQQWKLWREGRESRKKGSSKQTGLRSKGFYPVANTAYSKIYGVSEATASRYRMAAHNAGFIEVREQLRPTGLTDDNRLVVKFWKEEYGKQLVYKNGQYYEQGISVVQSKLIRKRISSLRWKK